MVKVGGEDLYRVDEELPPVPKEVGEEEWDDERLRRYGEHEPEGDPEEWINRLADQVEEKRLQKMQVLEKPGNVYDWRKKPYQLGDGASVKRWKRRSRLVARELLSLKEREMTFSHQRL